jgi:hypothetical protein
MARCKRQHNKCYLSRIVGKQKFKNTLRHHSKARLTYPPAKYDVLFHVSNGNVELYNPKKHGIWEIYVTEEGEKNVRKVSELLKNQAVIEVRHWSEVTDNLHEFSYVSYDESRPVYKRLSSFFHWYYFPQQDAFAPSKFLGYKDTTVENYVGFGSGTETNKFLTPFFVEVDKDSQQFRELYAKLETYISGLGKKVNKKVVSGSGGIYVSKPNWLWRSRQEGPNGNRAMLT